MEIKRGKKKNSINKSKKLPVDIYSLSYNSTVIYPWTFNIFSKCFCDYKSPKYEIVIY